MNCEQRDKLLPILIDATQRRGNEGIVFADLTTSVSSGQIGVKLIMRDEAAFVDLINRLRGELKEIEG